MHSVDFKRRDAKTQRFFYEHRIHERNGRFVYYVIPLFKYNSQCLCAFAFIKCKLINKGSGFISKFAASKKKIKNLIDLLVR